MPPRYAFEPGDWYVYEVRTEQRRLNGDVPQRRYVEQVQIWCLEQRAGWRLLLIDRIHVEQETVSPSETLLLWLDSQGRRQIWAECDHRLPAFDSTLNLLPLLPPVLSDSANWRSDRDHFGRVWQGATTATADNHLELQLRRLEPEALQVVSVVEAGGRVRFDSSLNVVRKLDWQLRDPAIGLEQTQRARLVKRARYDTAWLRSRRQEAERYRQILRSDNAMRVIALRPFTLAEAQTRIPRLWAEFTRELRQVADSPFTRICRAEQRRLADGATRLRFESLPLSTWLGTPARAWTLTRPDGTEIRSEAARTGVTFEWFYSAADPISLYAAPLVQQLAEALPPEVAVIAYNVDQDPTRAAATAERLAGPWTHVMASPLLELESLNILPAFRVLDAEGVIQAAAIGWQSDLARLPAQVLTNWKGARRLRGNVGNE